MRGHAVGVAGWSNNPSSELSFKHHARHQLNGAHIVLLSLTFSWSFVQHIEPMDPQSTSTLVVGDVSNPYSHAFTLTPASPAPARKITANVSHPFSRALALYPFLTSLTKHLDRTDLDSISRCCAIFYATLSPYRNSLLPQSLRCARPALKTSAAAPKSLPCARDLVRQCIRCHEAVCRVHPPPPSSPASHLSSNFLLIYI